VSPEESSRFFEKKRRKKLLLIAGFGGCIWPTKKIQKFFAELFFKKATPFACLLISWMNLRNCCLVDPAEAFHAFAGLLAEDPAVFDEEGGAMRRLEVWVEFNRRNVAS